ncbi:MAG: hypothetical protein MUF29_05790, partial [Chitinophagaceae bacterium]|nr:hypothetical protein [Chitinophagaceae bacterium]
MRIAPKRKRFLLICLTTFALVTAFAQQSMLVNLGSATCTNATAPSIAVIRQPLSASPLVLAQCSMSPQLPDYYSTFVAYNPADNKLYLCDIRSGSQSRTWRLDFGLPERIACPPAISATPTFTHSYVPNNFEFDNNGNLWSLTAYDGAAGQCRMEQFDVESGAVINTRVLQFPAGNFPTTITSGDLSILPNGRMFATLGANPSRLYEILNYNSPSGQATAVFLQALPKNCYGIAYLNGELEVTGSDLFTQCYAYRYSIADNVLGPERPFQNGLAPIDNTSFTPSIGATKQLLQATLLDAGAADITYEVTIRNMGNTILNDVNVEDDLAAAFGPGRVSAVSIRFAEGGNPAGLALNAGYNGTTDIRLLQPGQNLPNETKGQAGFFFKVIIECRVSGLSATSTYFNSAVARAAINNEVSRVEISDSSNNGGLLAMDPNNDGNPGGPGENEPTPFSLGVLPVRFLAFDAVRSGTQALLDWRVATPVSGGDVFRVEYSNDGRHWLEAGRLPIVNGSQSSYRFIHAQAPASVT